MKHSSRCTGNTAYVNSKEVLSAVI